MPGDLFVLLRRPAPGAWLLVASALDPVQARDVAAVTLAANPGARVVVARAIRSVTATVTAADDATPVIDP